MRRALQRKGRRWLNGKMVKAKDAMMEIKSLIILKRHGRWGFDSPCHVMSCHVMSYANEKCDVWEKGSE